MKDAHEIHLEGDSKIARETRLARDSKIARETRLARDSKIALVTGASSGLGRAFFRLLTEKHEEIEEIWLIARRAERLTEMRLEAEANCPVRVKEVPLDLTKPESYTQLRELLEKSGADVRLLVNNAGCGTIGQFDEMPADGQLNIITLNNTALTAVTSVVLPYMKAGSGIINVCSIAAFAPNPRMAVYCSTKAYVLSFSKSLRFELKDRKINVLAVCPGPMRTEFLHIAGIEKGTSKTFDTLPYTDPAKAAAGALSAVRKGRGVYTPGLFFKFYRLVAKVLPHSLVVYLSKT